MPSSKTTGIVAAAAITAGGVLGNWAPSWISYMQSRNPADIVNSTTVADAIGRKPDAINGHLQNPSIQGGTASGTDIGSATANGVLLAKAVGQARSHYKVFMGSVSQMSAIAGDVTNSLSTGAIALYLHANGLAGLTSAQRQAIQSVWGAGGASILTGGGTAVGEVGSDIPDAGYLALFGGKYPQEVNVDLPTSVASTTYTATSTDAKPGTTYQNYLDAATEKQMETNFDGIISKAGTYNIAPFYTMQYDTDDDFATGAYYANYRKLALYSGGFAVDAPPQFYLGTGSTLLDKTAAMIKWGTDNHLRVFLLVTPFTNGAQNCGYQSDFLQSTQTFVSYLRTKGAVPTEYGAANYCGNTTNTVVNAPLGDDVPQSVNQVALWLATQPVSDAGTVTPGSPEECLKPSLKSPRQCQMVFWQIRLIPACRQLPFRPTLFATISPRE